jgi:hypothetical protein
MEECAEVTKDASKALRFGLDNKYQGTFPAERLAEELDDLIGVREMLTDRGVIRGPSLEAIDAKKQKVIKYMAHDHAQIEDLDDERTNRNDDEPRRF